MTWLGAQLVRQTFTVDLRLKLLRRDLAQVLGTQAPHADALSGARCHGCTERRRLRHGWLHCTHTVDTGFSTCSAQHRHPLTLRPGVFLTDWDAKDVGLQLHQQPVGRHPSVHLQLSERDAAVLVHGIQDLCTGNTIPCFFIIIDIAMSRIRFLTTSNTEYLIRPVHLMELLDITFCSVIWTTFLINHMFFQLQLGFTVKFICSTRQQRFKKNCHMHAQCCWITLTTLWRQPSNFFFATLFHK